MSDRRSEAVFRVVFRRWRDGGGIVAVFPEVPATIHGEYCLSYGHVGQHAAADYHAVVRHTRPATPPEYAALADELTRHGYHLLDRRHGSAYSGPPVNPVDEVDHGKRLGALAMSGA